MVSIVLVSLVLAICAVGWGHGFWSLVRKLSNNSINELPLGVLGFLGLFSIASLTTAYNFAAPVGFGLSVFVLVVGLALFMRLWMRPALGCLGKRLFVLSGLATAFGILAISTAPGYDGGLYHLPQQLWMRSESVVLGLANLHGRFGFNSLVDPLLAIAWLPHNDLAIAQIVTSLFRCFFFLALYENVALSTREGFSKLYLALMLIVGYLLARPLLGIASDRWAENDLASGLTLLLGCYYCIMSTEDGDASDFATGLVLVAFASAMKLSGVFAFPLLLLAAFRIAQRHGLAKIPIAASIVILACFLPWFLRGFLSTGCVVYPAASSCLELLPWNAATSAADDTRWIKAWARAPNTGLVHVDGWAWLPLWLNANRGFLINAALITAVMTVTAVMLARGSTISRWSRSLVIMIMISGLIPVIASFLFAPDPRFAFGHIVLFLLLPGFCVLAVREPSQPRGIRRVAAFMLLASPWALVAHQTMRYSQSYINHPLFVLRPLSIPPAEVMRDPVFGTRPVTGDQCWLAAPGCSPNRRNIEETRVWGYLVLKAK